MSARPHSPASCNASSTRNCCSKFLKKTPSSPQIFFLLSRYQQQYRVLQRLLAQSHVISDYTFAKDRIFAHLNLQGDELDTYERLHNALAENVVTPDLVVFLYADVPVLMERIAVRDRAYERSMSVEYIARLASSNQAIGAEKA